MGLGTLIAIGVIVLVAIGLGWGVFFSGLFRGAQVVSENPVVQNATRETIEAADDAADTTLSSNPNVIVVQSERTVYKVREPVVIVVKNEGDEKVVFSDSTPNVEIRNKDTGKTHDVTVTQVNTELEPGETVTITWKETSEIESGTYVAIVKAADGTIVGETTFTVEA
jgi:archaellum component FlaG (FlaF/FlaG flagellin family)